MHSGITSRLRDDQRGVTIIEFAILLIPLLTAIMGGLDLGYRMYVESVAQGAVRDAARMGTTGGSSPAELDAHVKKTLASVVDPDDVYIDKKSYHDFANVGSPEKITADRFPFGKNDGEDCFEDTNGNGVWDKDPGVNGLGGSDDIVSYEVTIDYHPLLPVDKLLPWATDKEINVSTVMRNQPFGTQGDPVNICPA